MSKCISRARKVIDTDILTDEEFAQIEMQAKAAVAMSKKDPNALTLYKERTEAWAKKQAAIKKRNAAFNASRKVEMADRVVKLAKPKTKWQRSVDRIIKGDTDPVRDILTGANSADSAIIAERQFLISWTNKVFSELEAKVGDDRHLKAFESGKMDRDIAQEVGVLYGRNKPTGNDIARDLAKFIKDFEDISRKRLNDAGAYIDEAPLHLLGQSWNSYKILKATGGDWTKWAGDIRDRLDWDATFGITHDAYKADPEVRAYVDGIMERWYSDLATDNHATLRNTDGESKGAGTGGSNVAKALSAERKIILKDGVSFYEMQQKYGQKNLVEAYGAALGTSARGHGLMSVLGPNYADNVEWMRGYATDHVSKMISEAKPGSKRMDQLLALKKHLSGRAVRTIQKDLAYLDGAVNRAGNDLAAWGMWARTLEVLSKMGSVAISMVPDPVNQIANANLQGQNVLGAAKDYVRFTLNGVPKKDQEAIIDAVGLAMNETRLSAMGDIDADKFGQGYANKVGNIFGKATFITQLSEKHRRTTNVMNISILSSQRNMTHAELPATTRELMKRVGIGEAEWDMIRTATEDIDLISGDKQTVISPSVLEDMDPTAFAQVANITDWDNALPALLAAKDKTIRALRSYYVLNAHSGSVEPTGRVRSRLLQGTSQDSLVGQGVRFVGQFKSFPISVISQRIVHDFSVRRAAGQKGGAYGALASYLVATSMAGYVAMELKALRDGRNLPEPESVSEATKLGIAAMLQGGGIGILGDVLLGDMGNRYGSNGLLALLGPGAGSAAQVLDLINETRTQMIEGDSKALPSLYRFVKTHVPFGNHFAVKPMFDAYVAEEVAEWLKPGTVQYVRDMQNRQMGTTYFRDIGESVYEVPFK